MDGCIPFDAQGPLLCKRLHEFVYCSKFDTITIFACMLEEGNGTSSDMKEFAARDKCLPRVGGRR